MISNDINDMKARRFWNVQAEYEKQQACKEYKKVIKRECKAYQKDFIKKLRTLKSSDPKAYWNILNQKSKLSSSTKLPSCTTFFDYFNNLQEGDNVSNEDNTTISDDETSATDVNNELLNAPFTREVSKCINMLKNNKSCGQDNILNEYLKSAGDQMLDIFVNLFNVVLFTGEVPTQWCLGEIIPLYKQKGSPHDPSNYRGITYHTYLFW